MSLTATGKGSVSATTAQVQGLWGYYRWYTHTAAHAASTAALTAFGLLVFVDPLFAVLAIASYVLPPAVLYSIDADAGGVPDSEPVPTHWDVETGAGDSSDYDSATDSDGDDGDSDSDGDDSDSDGDDGDTDSDR